VTPRLATIGVFFVNGAAVGAWISQIPFVKDRFDLSASTLGLVLLTMSIGVIVAVPVMGHVLVRIGSVKGTWIGATLCVAVVALLLLPPEPWLLPITLLAFGAASGAMDVSMNAHGVAIEKRFARPIMSSLHAGWSFGGFAAAALVGGATAAGLDPRVQNAVIAALLFGLLAVVLPRLGPGSAQVEESKPQMPSRKVLLLALLCFLVMVTEGGMGDWGGVYLREDLDASAGLAALAFAALAAGMTIGRVTGDALNRRFGATLLLQAGSAAAALALGGALLLADPVIALVGWTLVGIGVANGVPLLFSAAGADDEEHSGPAIAAVSSMGSIGFLVGPPFIGFLADATTLPFALVSLVLANAVVALLGRRAAGRTASGLPIPA
jgi:MFS family permease